MADLIDRQWLMECVTEGWIKFDTEKDKNRFVHLVRDIAPSAERKGHWIMLAHRKAKCSSCGVVEYTNGIDLTMSGCIFYATKPYCPHCGARMERE